jgi:protease PrsW
MLLLTLALAPGIAIVLFIYSRDNYDREPIKALLKSFLLGVLSILPAMVIQLIATAILKKYVAENTILYSGTFAFLVVGISEEYCKYFMVKRFAYTKPYFNEPFDGIIYSVMVAMGFATLENILYVYEHGIGTAIVRMFLSVPAHAAFGVIMGYHIGLAKFKPLEKTMHLIKGVVLAALLHGAFDFFLFLQTNKNVTNYVSEGFLFLGAVSCFVIAINLSMRSIRLHRAVSKATFGEGDTLS